MGETVGLPHLDRWLVGRMGWKGPGLPAPEELREWQLDRLRDLIVHAKAHSPYYGRRLARVRPELFFSAEDFSRVPMLLPDRLREEPEQLLCVSRDEIARTVTLTSSGTTGIVKRVFHTAADLEGIVDYFGQGMKNLMGPGQTALVLMPCERPGGTGQLLVEALARTGGRGVAHGVMEDVNAAIDQALEVKVDCIVGAAPHVNLFAHGWARRGLPKGQIQSVLLCWDVPPEAVARNVARDLGCRVFRHWGMIETGLGGAVECAPGSGMHLREAELYLEVIDPRTGRLKPDGETGELVVSMLLKTGMPIIRYRTGDMGRILPGTCACGSPMRRLDPLVYRKTEQVAVGEATLTLRELNEALYALPEVGDYAVWLRQGVLRVLVSGDPGAGKTAYAALMTIPAVAQGVAKGIVDIDMQTRTDGAPAIAGLAKRRIRRGRE